MNHSTHSNNPWQTWIQPLQDAWMQTWRQFGALQMPGSTAQGAQDVMKLFEQFGAGAGAVQFDAAQLQQLQQTYFTELADLWQQGTSHPAIAADRRFASDEWQKQPLSGFAAALHLINTRLLMGMVDAMRADAKTQARVRFAVEQWAAAAAPSNFLALNPDAQKKAIETHGESIARGVQNMLHDIRQGHLSMTDESQFEVGRNIATTAGSVIFENELFQLIEYKPLTEKVHERPFLFVPPCINKFYILDLQPDNSLVHFVLEQGHRAYMVSWRNPDAELAHTTWDDYVEKGIIKAIDTVLAASAADSLNALGFCVGGTLLGTGLAVLGARKQNAKVHSATFLTTFLDFGNTGVMDLFIDENVVRLREAQFAAGGLFPARDLATTFSFLRPNDLVWNYVVGNYLKGETPPPFDLLYWNCDSTNMAGPMYAWYLRNTYLENNLIKPDYLSVCGEKINLANITQPVYIYGSREDHIVPIDSAYASTQHLPGAKRFVMGASGHIAGVINPIKKNKRSYWVGEDAASYPADYNTWAASATEHAGSWWGDWAKWLKSHGGKQIAAPAAAGSAQYPALQDAPGSYVRAKASPHGV